MLYFIDSENNVILWGVLVLNDGGFVGLEGLHGIFVYEMVQNREALDSGRVKVDRKVKGEAWARTRIICDINPNKPMCLEGVFKCQALLDLPSIKHSADMSRWDIWVPFFIGQATPEEISKAKWVNPKIPLSVTRNHIFLAWQDKKMVWEAGVANKVNKLTKELLDKHLSFTIPLINNDVKNHIYRIACSFAQLLDSYSDDYSTLLVKKEHVELTKQFILENLQLNEYDIYVKDEKERYYLNEGEIPSLIAKLSKTGLGILMGLRFGPQQSSVLAEQLEVTDVTVRNYARALKAQKLIHASEGRSGGYALTARGNQLLKYLLKEPEEFQKIESRMLIEIEPVEGKCALCGETATLTHNCSGNRICKTCADIQQQQLGLTRKEDQT